ncbi:MAG TPA: ferrous iron transporter B, partial [Holophagaceae bacterium]|nr:ferrous iron transporter B [Holophagaceae bacterium]
MNGRAISIALAGNPNCGKTTLFNALTGARHHVGNWPGVTVEKRTGAFTVDGLRVEVVDLPGCYSLSARSEDERIAAHHLGTGEVDLILNVLDASNLERNLFLTTQLLELGKPIVFVLNMMDDAGRRGISVDVPVLETLLGGPVIPTVGNREEGIDKLKEALASAAKGADPRLRRIPVDYGHDLEGELAKLEAEIGRDELLAKQMPMRWLALQLLEGGGEACALAEASHAREAIEAQIAKSKAFLEHHLGNDAAGLIAEHRYGFTHGLVTEAVKRPDLEPDGATGRIDSLLTHQWLGIPIFLGALALIYTLSFVIGQYPQDWIGAGFTALSTTLAAHLPPGELTSLLTDGVIPGVSAVMVFLPVIMILMGCISFLEDTGYMARAAFIM